MRRLLAYSAVIALLALGAQAANAGTSAPAVLVVTAPLTPYVNAILENVGQAQSLLKPGQDPHHFSMAPSQAAALANADILIIPDLSMSPMVASYVQKNPHLTVIELSKLPGADPKPYTSENPWLSAVKDKGHDADDDSMAMPALKTSPDPNYKHLPDFNAKAPVKAPTQATTDPHFWLDPERMAAIAPSLANALSQSMPDARPGLLRNAQTLAAHLRQEVLPGMRALLSTPAAAPPVDSKKPRIAFITYHAAYHYFLDRFSIQDSGEITVRPEDYMGAKTLDQLLNVASGIHIGCVIAEGESPVVSRVTKLSGAKLVILSPEQLVDPTQVPHREWVQNDYDRLLYLTAKKFGECL